MKNSNLSLSILLILFFTISSCNQSKKASEENTIVEAPEFNLQAMKSMVLEKNRAFTQAHITGDLQILNDYFTEDARVQPPNSKIVIGKEAISKLNAEYVSYDIHEFNEETHKFYGNEDFLIDEGSYFMIFGEDSLYDKGKYINVWIKEQGEWRVSSNIWNSDIVQ